MTATHNRASARKAGVDSLWGKAKTEKDRSRNGSKDECTLRIEQAIEQKNWKEARQLIQEDLIFKPTDHWLWFSLSLTFYEEKEYEKALASSTRAVELAPNCPLALWHYAGSLFM